MKLFESGWQDNPKFRPSCSEMVAELDCMWKFECHNLIVDTDVRNYPFQTKHFKIVSEYVIGIEREFVIVFSKKDVS